MANDRRTEILEGHVPTVLKNMTLPMIFGVWGIVAFNLADAFFVSSLGMLQMAALTFTFPVVLIINSLNLGLGVGASSVISQAMGRQDKTAAKRLATSAVILGLLLSIFIVTIGELTISPLFRLLGANEELPYVTDYMRVWYASVPIVVVQMVGNNIIRALGDTKTPSYIMLTASIINIILDPLFILGIGIFPALSVAGAALATLLARSIGFIYEIYILFYREKIISLRVLNMENLLDSWKKILFIGLPNAFSKMILPIGTGIITGLIATFGTEAIAGYGVATKVEFFAISLVNALSAIIPVYVGQNYGAKKLTRIREGIKLSTLFSLVSSAVIYVLLFFLARPISYLFTDNSNVSDVIVLYLRIVPIGYAFQGILLIINAALNALHKPVQGALLTGAQMFLIYVPLATLLTGPFGILGIFGALMLSYLIISIIAHIYMSILMRRMVNTHLDYE